MRIVLHDYPGHAFPVQLSRELARRGHEVHHLHTTFFQGPKGKLQKLPDDPDGFHIEGLSLGEAFAKYSFVKRWQQERAFGHILADRIEALNPDVVFSGNAPLDPQAILLKRTQKLGLPFVFWLQDIYSVAIDRIMRAKVPVAGALIGWRYTRFERHILRQCDAIVGITDDFRPILEGWGIPADRVTTVENWAPLEDMPLRDRRNSWSAQHGLDDKTVFLYSGSMGLKHNPALMLDLANHVADRSDIRVVVISEGQGADWLEAHRGNLKTDNLILLPFQPVEVLPEAMASADAHVAVLEPDAGVFSVPSKILNYLCSGRPVLAGIPPENLAARNLEREDAGLIAHPDDAALFCAQADRLADDAALRQRLGINARAYAERAFDIAAIGDTFEALLQRVVRDRQTH